MDQKPVQEYEEDTREGTVVQSTMVESRMEAALMKDNPSPFRKSFLRMYACIFVGYLCSATNGFDANTFGRFIFSLHILLLPTSSLKLTEFCSPKAGCLLYRLL